MENFVSKKCENKSDLKKHQIASNSLIVPQVHKKKKKKKKNKDRAKSRS